MPVNDRESLEQHLPEIIAQLQSSMIATKFVLTEVLYDLARTQPNPRAYLASAFERVISRLEQVPLEQWKQADTNIKDDIERLFHHAVRDL